MLEKPLMKVLLHIPYVDDRLLAKVKENLCRRSAAMSGK